MSHERDRALVFLNEAQAELTELSERISMLLSKESQELLDTAGDAIGRACDLLVKADAMDLAAAVGERKFPYGGIIARRILR